MIKTLCLDFGNTRLKAALFENDRLVAEQVLPDDSDATMEKLLADYQPQKTILSSVIDHNPVAEQILAQNSNFHKLSHLTKVNFTTPVGKPESIGADRLALVAAAVHYFPGKNNLVIALGSCITYNFINQYHVFLGGAISPGMEMRFKSMNDHTALLPLVKKDWNFPIIAYDTKTNLQSGVIAGITYEIAGFIEFYAEKYGNFNVVLTGGDAGYFARQLKYKIFADLNFLFKGLYALSETNTA
ncbi:MAG: type III pantothenate kinase [Ferruginibacter sp.]